MYSNNEADFYIKSYFSVLEMNSLKYFSDTKNFFNYLIFMKETNLSYPVEKKNEFFAFTKIINSFSLLEQKNFINIFAGDREINFNVNKNVVGSVLKNKKKTNLNLPLGNKNLFVDVNYDFFNYFVNKSFFNYLNYVTSETKGFNEKRHFLDTYGYFSKKSHKNQKSISKEFIYLNSKFLNLSIKQYSKNFLISPSLNIFDSFYQREQFVEPLSGEQNNTENNHINSKMVFVNNSRLLELEFEKLSLFEKKKNRLSYYFSKNVVSNRDCTTPNSLILKSQLTETGVKDFFLLYEIAKKALKSFFYFIFFLIIFLKKNKHKIKNKIYSKDLVFLKSIFLNQNYSLNLGEINPLNDTSFTKLFCFATKIKNVISASELQCDDSSALKFNCHTRERSAKILNTAENFLMVEHKNNYYERGNISYFFTQNILFFNSLLFYFLKKFLIFIQLYYKIFNFFCIYKFFFNFDGFNRFAPVEKQNIFEKFCFKLNFKDGFVVLINLFKKTKIFSFTLFFNFFFKFLFSAKISFLKQQKFKKKH